MEGKKIVKVSASTLNQWAMDFEGNVKRIIQSIQLCYDKGAKLRVGCELEICGYSCEDHFLEFDTLNDCWMSLVEIVRKSPNDIICDVG